MSPSLTITKIPLFNSVVIKQLGAHHFISAPNSIVFGKESYLLLLEGLLRAGFIQDQDLVAIVSKVNAQTDKELYENDEDDISTDSW